MRPDIQSYIEQNRATYTREAIDKNLREAGWTEQEIATAWQRHAAGQHREKLTGGKAGFGSCLLVLVLALVVLGGIGIAFFASGYLRENSLLSGIVLGTGAVLLLAWVVYALHLVPHRRRWAIPAAAGIALLTYLAWIVIAYLIFAGVCIAIALRFQ